MRWFNFMLIFILVIAVGGTATAQVSPDEQAVRVVLNRELRGGAYRKCRRYKIRLFP